MLIPKCIVARGIVSIPKSVTPERIAANTKTIKLTKDDVAALNSIHEKEGIQRLIKPNWGIGKNNDSFSRGLLACLQTDSFSLLDLGFPDWVV